MTESILVMCNAFMGVNMDKYNIVRLPDDESYRCWKMYPDTIVIHYGESLDTFLLLGDEKALLIDTAYGRGEFPNIVEEMRADRELLVVNTHGHYDHTGGNPWFPRVYMHANAKAYAKRSFSPIDAKWIENMPYPDYEMISIDDGYVFKLGGRDVEVLYTPAHCDSSLMFIDHGRHLLFSGDEFDSGQANMSCLGSIEAFYKHLLRLQSRRSEFDFIMPNHNGCPICTDYLDDFETAVRHVIEGKPDVVPFDDLPQYKKPFSGQYAMRRVQVGMSCVNYPIKD